MTEDEFARMLAIAVAQGQISEDEAAELLRRFRADELRPIDLPLPADEAVRGADDDAMWLALLALLVAAGLPRPTSRANMGVLSMAARIQARNVARSAFHQNVGVLAGNLTQTGNVRAWHMAMQRQIRDYLAQQMAAGLGRALGPTELAYLDDIVRTQESFLYRYAAEVAARQNTSNPLSEAYIANRADQYAGEGWAAWFEASERELTGQDGLVIDYIARDDGATCSPCRFAMQDGPYLPGTGPYPGQVCLGAGNCRCERRPRFAPEEWARLMFG